MGFQVQGPLERMLDKRMNKIKRAIIEITSCQADSVVIDRSESIIYTVDSNSGSLQQVASVSTEDGSVTWVDGDSQQFANGHKHCMGSNRDNSDQALSQFHHKFASNSNNVNILCLPRMRELAKRITSAF